MITEVMMADFKNPGKLFIVLFSLRRKLESKKLREYCGTLGLKGDEHVLEPGSGTGALTVFLSRLVRSGGSVTCVDTSAPLMDIARRNLISSGNINFYQCDIKDLPPRKGGFNACVIHYMLHDVHKAERAAFVKRIYTLLSSGGKVFVREPIGRGHGMPAEEISSLMKSAGFREVSSVRQKRMFSWPLVISVFVKE